MRILMGLFVVVLLAAWGPTPAAAQCDMVCPDGKAATKAKTKRAHHHHHAAVKKHKKHAHEIYMKAAPY